MTPIIMVTHGDIGRSLIEYAYKVLEKGNDVKKDIYYLKYDYTSSHTHFHELLCDTIFIAHSNAETEEHPIPGIIIFSDILNGFTEIITKTVQNMKDLGVIFIPTINLALLVEILYKRLYSYYITYDDINRSNDYLNYNPLIKKLIADEEERGIYTMIKFKHNDYQIEPTNNGLIAKRKLTDDELAHWLLSNDQVLESDDFYIVPKINEDGHTIFYRVPKEG